MQNETLQVALASLVSNPGPVSGWESSIIERLDYLPKLISAGITTPTGNAAWSDGIFNSVTLNAGRPQIFRRSYAPVHFSLHNTRLVERGG